MTLNLRMRVRIRTSRSRPPEDRNPDGTPTNTNPTVTIADFGAAPIGVPNFVIDSVHDPALPPPDLPGLRNPVRESRGRCSPRSTASRPPSAPTSTSRRPAPSAGCSSSPPSWEAYGVDANNDGRKDPYNPVDAICAAANYLDAAGGAEDLSTAIFAYNHADWYVDEVLLYARQYGKIPDDLVGSLTGLTEGAHFPVAAKSRYADDISEREALERATPTKGSSGNAADVISSSPRSAASTSTAARARPSLQSTTASSSGWATRSGSASTSSSRTPTETASPTPSSARWPRPTRCRSSARTRCATSSSSPRRSRTSPPRPASSRRTTKDSKAKAPPKKAVRADQHRGHAHTALRLPRARGQPGPGGPDRPARRAPGPPDAGVRRRQVLLLERPALRRRQDGPRPAREGLEGRRRHDPRPGRQDRRARPPPPLRDPPDRPRRTQDRSQADPRRLEAPRGDRHLSRGGQEPLRRHRRHDRPGPAHVEGAADQARPRQQPARALGLRPRLRPRRPDRPARSSPQWST